MVRFFLSVYDYFSHHRRQLFGLLSLMVAFFVYATMQIRFNEDISGFLPDDQENERINNAYHFITSANNITVYCSSHDDSADSKDLQIEAIDLLVEKLESLDTGFIKRLFYKVDPERMLYLSSFIVQHMPYFLDESDYQRLDTLLTDDFIINQIEKNKDILLSPAGMMIKENLLNDPLGISHDLLLKLQDFQIGGQFQLFQDYVFTGDNKGFLLIECKMPVSETVKNAAFITLLNGYMSEIESSFNGKIHFTSFGAAEIGLGNATQIKRDTIRSSIFAIILIFCILIYAFRNVRKILLPFVSVFFGGLFALAFMYLVRGEVSLIAIGISSIMFGIAINYPLHFIDHYNHIPNPRLVIREIFEPLTIGNITTVGAFLSLVFIASDSMVDLGLFASLLLTGTILFVLVFLPHLLPNNQVNPFRRPASLIHAFNKPVENNRWVICGILFLTIIFAFFSGNSRFETDLQKINYMTGPQQEQYERMMELLNRNQHVVYFVTEGEDLEQVLVKNEALAGTLKGLIDNGMISKVGGIGDFYPSNKKTGGPHRSMEFFLGYSQG